MINNTKLLKQGGCVTCVAVSPILGVVSFMHILASSLWVQYYPVEGLKHCSLCLRSPLALRALRTGSFFPFSLFLPVSTGGSPTPTPIHNMWEQWFSGVTRYLATCREKIIAWILCNSWRDSSAIIPKPETAFSTHAVHTCILTTSSLTWLPPEPCFTSSSWELAQGASSSSIAGSLSTGLVGGKLETAAQARGNCFHTDSQQIPSTYF